MKKKRRKKKKHFSPNCPRATQVHEQPSAHHSEKGGLPKRKQRRVACRLGRFSWSPSAREPSARHRLFRHLQKTRAFPSRRALYPHACRVTDSLLRMSFFLVLFFFNPTAPTLQRQRKRIGHGDTRRASHFRLCFHDLVRSWFHSPRALHSSLYDL